MAISEQEFEQISSRLAGLGADMGAIADLRERYRHLTWTSCDARDVFEGPFRSFANFDLHLLDGSDHCAQVTSELPRATGILLARRTRK